MNQSQALDALQSALKEYYELVVRIRTGDVIVLNPERKLNDCFKNVQAAQDAYNWA